MGRSHILDLFVGTVFDAWAQHNGQSVRWARARTDTRERWLDYAGVAATFANSTQVSSLTREPIANPPDRNRMFALQLSSLVRDGRSRATTTAGLRRSRKATSGDLDTFWLPATNRGFAAVDAWISAQLPEQLEAATDALSQSSLRLAAPDRPLELSEAPY